MIYSSNGLLGADAPRKAMKRLPVAQGAGATPAPNPTPLGTTPDIRNLATDGPGQQRPSSVNPVAQTGGPNLQGVAGGFAAMTGFNPTANLIGQQIAPSDSGRTSQAGQFAQRLAGQYFNRTPMTFQQAGPADTSRSQSIYDQALKLATAGQQGGGSPYDALAAQLNGKVSGALDKVLDGPDRGALAGGIYDTLVQRSQPQFEQGLRAIGKKAAALGRVGAGMTTNELTDFGLARERDLDLSRKELANEAAGQSLADRLAQLQAVQGVAGGVASAAGAYGAGRANMNQQAFDNLLTLGRDLYGRERDTYGDTVNERNAALGYDRDLFDLDRTRFGDATGYEAGERANDLSRRNELRGERDYQYGLDRDALNDRVQQTLLEDQLLNSRFGRARDRYAIGSEGNPSGVYGAAAQDFGNEAAGSFDALGDLFSQYAYNRAQRPRMPTREEIASVRVPDIPQVALPTYGGG